MPVIVYDIINILGSGLRLIGMAAFGAAFGWLAVDLLNKAQAWPMQAILYLGLAGLAIAMTVFLGLGALGAFGIGIAVAFFVWGMPRKKKEEDEDKK